MQNLLAAIAFSLAAMGIAGGFAFHAKPYSSAREWMVYGILLGNVILTLSIYVWSRALNDLVTQVDGCVKIMSEKSYDALKWSTQIAGWKRTLWGLFFLWLFTSAVSSTVLFLVRHADVDMAGATNTPRSTSAPKVEDFARQEVIFS